MKKFFTFIAAMLFAGSMMAEPIVINATDVTGIESGATSGLDVTLQGINIVWQGAYYNSDGGDGGSASVDFRVYANKSMTLTAESNISKVEIAGYCKAGLTVTANAGTITTGASYASETTKSDIEDPLIVVDDINAASVTLTCTKQMRAYTIRITLGEGGEPVVVDTYTVAGNDAAIFGTSWDVTNTANDMVKAAGIYKWEKAELNLTAGTIIAFKVAKNHSWDVAYPAQNDTVTIAEEGEYTLTITFDPTTEAVAAEAVKKVALADPTNCAEAAAAALTVSANNVLYNDGAVYTINGFVTEIAYAYDQAKGNMSFWMADAADGGKVLEAYKCAIAAAADAPAVGDKVAVTGKLTKYGTTPEFAAGCTVTIIERAGGEEPPVQELDTVTVAEAIEACMALDSAAVSEVEYIIEGYVVNAQDFNIAYNNQIFFLADDAANSANQEFEVYGGVAIENNQFVPVLNGDKVQVTAKLKKYWDNKNKKFIAETVNGTVVFVTKVDGDRTIATSTEITVAEALTIGGALEANGKTTDTYDIVGYVTQIDDNSFNTSYNNMTFWIADAPGTAATNADGAFEVYRGKPDQELEVGDKVRVRTQIQNYKGNTIESVSGASVTFIEKGDVTPVEEADVVFDKDDFAGQGQAATQTTPGGAVSATKSGVTFTCDNAYGDGQYGVRCYQGGNITISSTEQQIGKIVFEFATVSGKYYNGGLDEEIVVNGMEWSATGLASQARMNKIKIYFGEYEAATIDTITVAQAVEIGMALEDNATTEKDYVVAGWVVQAYAPNEGYTDQTWFMADEQGAFGEFEAFHCTPDYLVENDQFVYVKGKIQKYVKDSKVQIEIGKGTATHRDGQGIENVVLTEKAQKVVVDGVIYIIRDNKMFNLQGAQVR